MLRCCIQVVGSRDRSRGRASGGDFTGHISVPPDQALAEKEKRKEGWGNALPGIIL